MATTMFIRGSLVEIVAMFTPTDGGTEAPTSANAQFVFIDQSGNTEVANVPLTYQSTSGLTTTWTGSWNSQQVLAGSTVTWLVTCSGPLVAAGTGAFIIETPNLVPAPLPASSISLPSAAAEPTLQGFQCWVQCTMGIPPDVYATAGNYVSTAYCVAKAIVEPNLALIGVCDLDCAGLSIYALAVYNLGGSNLVNYAQDPPYAPNVPKSDPPAPFWENLRNKWNIFGFSPGVVQSTSDESTSASLQVIESAKNFTLANLQQLKDPWGRRYLALAQSWGPVWGIS